MEEEYYFKYTREHTRDEKINFSKKGAVTLPVSLACIHLLSDANLGFMVRAAACFGASEVLVIGRIPDHRILRQLSCGTANHMKIRSFSNTREFLSYIRENGIHLVSLEVTDSAVSLTGYKFPLDRQVCIITGNETTGVPGDIISSSDSVFIPNPGFAPCMNTSQAANVALYEYVRQSMGV